MMYLDLVPDAVPQIYDSPLCSPRPSRLVMSHCFAQFSLALASHGFVGQQSHHPHAMVAVLKGRFVLSLYIPLGAVMCSSCS